MTYIDSQLATRNAAQSTRLNTNQIGDKVDSTSKDHRKDQSLHKQPAALGKLMEIDLGPDARAKNIAATEAARRGEPLVDEEEGTKGKGKGKPHWRRRRRNSEDIRRDLIVEQVLKESRRTYQGQFYVAVTNGL